MNPTALPAAPAPRRHRGRTRAAAAVLAVPEHPAPTFRAALDEMRPALPDIAVALGIVPRTLSAYYTGNRGVPAWVQRQTAAYVRMHAARLEQLAALLDLEAGEVDPRR